MVIKKNNFKTMWIYFSKYVLILIFLSCIIFSCNNKPNNAEHVVTTNTNETKASTEVIKEPDKKTILFFGNSLTAGYGLEEEESFPSLIQNRMDSLHFEYHVINGGLSGETSAGGKGRIEWVLNQNVDIFILELGANDMLRGLDLKATNQNLKDILNIVKSKYPSAILIIAGMKAPPNMGKEYVMEFQNIFSSLAREFEAGLIPFLLDKVAGNPELILSDGKHPNADGQKIVMENVWDVLENYLI